MRHLLYKTTRGESDLPLLRETMDDAMMKKEDVMVIMKDDGEIYKSSLFRTVSVYHVRTKRTMRFTYRPLNCER